METKSKLSEQIRFESALASCGPINVARDYVVAVWRSRHCRTHTARDRNARLARNLLGVMDSSATLVARHALLRMGLELDGSKEVAKEDEDAKEARSLKDRCAGCDSPVPEGVVSCDRCADEEDVPDWNPWNPEEVQR